MRHTHISHLVILVLVSWMLAIAACSALSPPPSLTPQAQAAWTATQAIQTMDLLRDIAIAANDQKLISEDSTRAIVKWHLEAINVVHAIPLGWQATVKASLTDLTGHLSAQERARLGPYLKLVSDLVERGSL